MHNITFYKFTLEVNTAQSKGSFSLPNCVHDIVDAKDRYNTRFAGSRHILLLRLTSSTVELILRLDNHVSGKGVNIRTLHSFVKTLKHDFNWKSHFKQDAARLFNASIVKQLDASECKRLIHELVNEQNDYFDPVSAKSLFLNVQEDKAEVSAELYDQENSGPPFEIGTTSSLEEAVSKISELRGISEFKKEISKIVAYCKAARSVQMTPGRESFPLLPYHYVFQGDNGINLLQPSRLLTEVLFHLGAVSGRKFVRINISEAGNTYSGINLEEYMEENDTGVVYIEQLFDTDDDVDSKKVSEKLIEKMQQLRGKTVFILSFPGNGKEDIRRVKLLEYMDQRVNYRKISFSFYNDEDIKSMISHIAEKNGLSLDKEAVIEITRGLKQLSSAIPLDTEYTISRYLERAVLDKGFTGINQSADQKESALYSLSGADFSFINEKSEEGQSSPMIELDEMVGLKEVKSRVSQIVDNVTVRVRKKELGLINNPVCLHMAFTGNPGTGKTTVARLLGRIFKKLGFLSTGNFLEVTRDSLIGQYIGQTTPKVRKAVKEAKGGILFIDEAYNLYQPYENDFGYEAVAELVKCMEDYKDDLVVIFAGYPREMEQMIIMNPGLRDRIAFKINFPDYSEEELFEIFRIMLKAGGYKADEAALEEVRKLLSALYAKKDKNFGNARVVRKLYERAEMAQNSRVCSEGLFEPEEIILLKQQDIKHLYQDTEITGLLKKNSTGGSIGFRV